MTASSADRKIPKRDSRGGRAIVIGGSITGLLAARALTEHFGAVTLIERDNFPDGPDFRKGLPQMRHVHVLLKQGEQVMEHYFPDLLPELLAGGANLIDMGGDLRWFNFGNWKTRFQSGVDFFSQTRGFLEWKIRQARRIAWRRNPGRQLRGAGLHAGRVWPSERREDSWRR